MKIKPNAFTSKLFASVTEMLLDI